MATNHPSPTRARLLGAALAATAAHAASPAAAAQGVPPAGPAAPAAPAAIAVDARSLKAGSWSYRTTVTAGGQTRTIERTLTVTPATLGRTAAWLLVDRADAGPAAITDSLYLTRSDAMPLRQRLHEPQLGVALDFDRDSVRGTMSLPQGTGPIAARYTPGSMVTGTMLEMYLRLLPVAPGWTGQLTMGGIGSRGAMSVPLSLAVTGQERITVPAGTFPAYVVRISAPGNEQTAWLNRDTREVLRIHAAIPQVTGSTIETVLISRR